MAILIDELPFFSVKRDIQLPDGKPEEIKANQILLWMSVTPQGSLPPSANAPRFPVIFDTGLNISMTMRCNHFIDWADVEQPEYQFLGDTSCNGSTVILFDVDAWLYKNAPGRNDQILNQSPIRLVLKGGLGVYNATPSQQELLMSDDPLQEPGPRLPTLGMFAITANKLSIQIEGWRRRVRIQHKTA